MGNAIIISMVVAQISSLRLRTIVSSVGDTTSTTYLRQYLLGAEW